VLDCCWGGGVEGFDEEGGVSGGEVR
jgi:hypothetical protein